MATKATTKPAARRSGPAGSTGRLELTHFGAAAWRITDGTTTVYVDPYFSRLRTVKVFGHTYPPPSDDRRHVYRYDEVPVSDTKTIDKHVTKADYILISHSHFNHCMDMPYIAKKTGAMVISTESTANLARASGVPDRQLIPVQGGEDFDFGAISVKAIPSLHSSLVIPSPYSTWDNCRYFDSRKVPGDIEGPPKLADYVEGGTLAWMIRFGDRRIVVLCSMNYIEKEMQGLDPEIVLVPSAHWRLQVYDYTGRLLRALGKPPRVIATHWDLQTAPYGAPMEVQWEHTKTFIAEVKKVSPESTVTIPKHFETVRV